MAETCWVSPDIHLKFSWYLKKNPFLIALRDSLISCCYITFPWSLLVRAWWFFRFENVKGRHQKFKGMLYAHTLFVMAQYLVISRTHHSQSFSLSGKQMIMLSLAYLIFLFHDRCRFVIFCRLWKNCRWEANGNRHKGLKLVNKYMYIQREEEDKKVLQQAMSWGSSLPWA